MYSHADFADDADLDLFGLWDDADLLLYVFCPTDFTDLHRFFIG